MITKKFVVPDSRVSFDYRVDGRKCRHPTFLMGCDGLGFFIDDKQVVNYTGSVFFWSTVTFNLTTVSNRSQPGVHGGSECSKDSAISLCCVSLYKRNLLT